MRGCVKIIVFALAMLVFAACDKGSDGVRRSDDPKDPGIIDGPNRRPSPDGGDWDFEAELNDDCLRFIGGGIRLRFDRAGVLVKSKADGSGSFIDLDGETKVDFQIGRAGTDSVCADSWIAVDGRRLENVRVVMKKQTASAVWYHVGSSQANDGGYMLVTLR